MSSKNIFPSTLSKPVSDSSTSRVSTPDRTKTDPENEDAKHRVAQRFFLKKTKRFYDTRGYLLQCPLSQRSSISGGHSKRQTTVLDDSPRECQINQGIKRKRGESGFDKTTLSNGLNPPKSKTSEEKDNHKSDALKFAKPKVYYCEYCKERKFLCRTSFFNHLRRHSLQDLLRCRTCNQKFHFSRYIGDLKRHQVKCRQRFFTK